MERSCCCIFTRKKCARQGWNGVYHFIHVTLIILGTFLWTLSATNSISVSLLVGQILFGIGTLFTLFQITPVGKWLLKYYTVNQNSDSETDDDCLDSFDGCFIAISSVLFIFWIACLGYIAAHGGHFNMSVLWVTLNSYLTIFWILTFYSYTYGMIPIFIFSVVSVNSAFGLYYLPSIVYEIMVIVSIIGLLVPLIYATVTFVKQGFKLFSDVNWFSILIWFFVFWQIEAFGVSIWIISLWPIDPNFHDRCIARNIAYLCETLPSGLILLGGLIYAFILLPKGCIAMCGCCRDCCRDVSTDLRNDICEAQAQAKGYQQVDIDLHRNRVEEV